MTRIYRPVQLPNGGINQSLLVTELQALGDVSINFDTSWRVDIITESVSNEDVQTVIDAHDGSVLTDEQKVQEAAVIALAQGKVYLRKQLLNPSPNVNSIYSTIKAAVDGNAYLAQIVDNQIALMSNSFGWTLDLVTPTATDKQRYILVVEQVIALLS